MLHVQGVRAEISNKPLLEDITFHVEFGMVAALVGHNGAGKSTLLKTIVGVLPKSAGKIMINETYDQDQSLITFKQLISYLPEEPLLLPELTAMQHFQLYGKSYQIAENRLTERLERLVEGFEMQDKLNEYPETLSKGMRQKVQAICTLLPDTPVLLIDEPFMGLDIHAVHFLEEIIKEKSRKGTSILLTTHQLDRVKAIADSFIMLQEGRIKSIGPITDFDTIQGRSTK
ncbi:MAG TPA: ABC transporter ATP-binding protein [Bacillota bacterium]